MAPRRRGWNPVFRPITRPAKDSGAGQEAASFPPKAIPLWPIFPRNAMSMRREAGRRACGRGARAPDAPLNAELRSSSLFMHRICPKNAYTFRSDALSRLPIPCSSKDQPLLATVHLSFQAFCSFRNLARPACTGTVGLALMPAACRPMKSLDKARKPGSIEASFSRF